MSVRLRLGGNVGAGATRHAIDKLLSTRLRIPYGDAQWLTRELPTTLPLVLESSDAEALSDELRRHGLECVVVPVPTGNEIRCSTHPHLLEGGRCHECSKALCVICARRDDGSCRDCARRRARKKRWQRIRISFLLFLLGALLLVGVSEYRRRTRDWDTPHRVAIVLVVPAHEALAPELFDAFRARSPLVAAALDREFGRYRAAGGAPFTIDVFGPFPETAPPPAPPSDGFVELFQFNRALARYATGFTVEGDFDVTLFVRTSAPSLDNRASVEGLSQHRGQMGVVSAELAPHGLDFAWFVTIHELLHTRGASDKYGPDGRALVPDGLAEPQRDPLYPQPFIELMARGRPISAEVEDAPGSVDTWRVGRSTAAEIGWTEPAAAESSD